MRRWVIRAAIAGVLFGVASLQLPIGSANAATAGTSPIASKAAPCAASKNSDRPWLDTTLTPECRADALIAQLKTLDEKFEVLGFGLQRYGISNSMASDGPAGPTHAPGAANLPNGISLAASFDPALAADYGAAVGREFRAAGVRQMLGPTVDIARTWRSGRVPEAFGEDPLLSASIAAPLVKKVQEQGVAVALKHFAVYTQEQGRTGDMPFGLHPAVNNVVSERAVREIYLPPFRAAVEEGGALGVMCGFPRINGVYACENLWLLGILKNEWGMRGTVTPDFPDAQRTVVAAVNAGLDTGNFGLPRPPMASLPGVPPAPAGPPPGAAHPPGPPPPGPPGGFDLGAALGMNRIPGGVDLKTAVQSGQISDARLNDMIRRKLVTLFAVGAESASPPNLKGLGGAEAQALALRVAQQGAVLLRNEKTVLPIATSVRSIAVIGAQAGPNPQVSTSGSAYVPPRSTTTALEAIKRRAGSSSVTFAQGTLKLGALPLVPNDVLRTPDNKTGLRVEYYPNPNLKFSGTAIHTGDDPLVDVHTPAPIANLPANNGWSARWSGSLTPRASGVHTFTISGSGSARLYIGNELKARFERVDFGTVAYALVPLERGRPVNLRVEFTPREAAPLPLIDMMGTSLGTGIRLGWAEPDDRIDRAVDAARHADVAVVFVADRQGEGSDRTVLNLPGDQDTLVAAVAAANPRTIVVLNTAGPVSMPWATKVAAILQLWYPGDAFSEAATRLLFGDAVPEGRLPITFPTNESQGPATATRNYPGTVDANGALENASFDEGLLVGYRWFDARNQSPLFPFGYGLTYSALRVENITLKPTGETASVRATVINDGTRADAEVLQVYVGFPSSAGEPPKRLAAFGKARVPAAGRISIDIAIPASAFQTWNESSHQWQRAPGPFEIMVGRSSRDILYRASLPAVPTSN